MLRRDWRLKQVWNLLAPDMWKGLLTPSTLMLRAAEALMPIRQFYSS
jgi:hypothetical protein